jgi:Tol biopolymer transport system component
MSYAISEIFTVPSTGGTPRQITYDNKTIMGLSWMADGKHIVFSSNRATSQKLWSVRLDGSEFKLLDASGQNSTYPTVSRDGHNLVFTETYGGDTDIGRIPITGDLKAQRPEKFISSQKNDLFLHISSNGKQYVFQSDRSGCSEIWKCDPNGKNLVQLTTLNTDSGTPIWSPDDTRIVFCTWFDGNRGIFTVSGDGGKPVRITSDTRDEILPSWSSDGAWIYYCLLNKGDNQIWKIPSSGGTPIQVTHNGGYMAVEAPDGRSVYFYKQKSPHLWQCDLNGENETVVVESLNDYRVWSVYPEGIYFIKQYPNYGNIHIDLYSFASKKTRTLAVLGALAGAVSPLPSPDRQWLYVTFVEKFAQSDIIMVENF